ncbi:MAG: phage holin family protein [Austwickia sp.]|nr:phage holin family protein [Austwickia sp.]MBK8437633.1 phage holin family protein [Austwickia sp.]MBK9102919.1 phage holin family protein [Austwickia sp.]
MRTFALKTAVNGVALWLAAIALPDIRLGEQAPELSNRLITIVLVAIVFGVVNAVMKPMLTLFSLPMIVVTLGLFTIVVNAILLAVTAAIAGALGLDFYVDSFFWSAIIGALIISFVSMLLNTLVKDERSRADRAGRGGGVR